MAAKSVTKLQLVRKADPSISTGESVSRSSVQKTSQKKSQSSQRKPRKTNSAPKTARANPLGNLHKNQGQSQGKTSPARAQNTAWMSAIMPSSWQSSLNPKMMENVMAQAKSQMDRQSQKMDKMTQDATALGREQFDAMIKSCNSLARGCEELIRTSMSIAQNAAERQSQFMKQAMSSKTVNEWAEVQNKIAQANFDDFMSGATKISEMSVKIMTECTQPLNDQIGKSMRKASESMAA